MKRRAAGVVLGFLVSSVLACGSDRSGFAAEPAPAFACAKENDCDDDGYPAPADCNDQNKGVNPGAYDFPGLDNDCDGTVDNPTVACETIPTENPGSPSDFARAADVCAQPHFDPLIKAEWGQVKGYGPGQRIWISDTKKEQVGIVTSFGANMPRRGRTMAGLATGPWNARDPRSSPSLDDPDFHINDACKEIPLDANDCRALSYAPPAAACRYRIGRSSGCGSRCRATLGPGSSTSRSSAASSINSGMPR